MSWKPEIEHLRAREALAEKMGGEERVARQISQGKSTARARVDALLDDGSFHEIGKIAGVATYRADGEMDSFLPSNRVTGRGRIEGRPVGAGDPAIIESQFGRP
jgi:propionyl-CoA carboxylase beta chain